MRVLIPEVLERNVLAAVRSLGRSGHKVTLAMATKSGKRPLQSRFVSRFVQETVYVQSPHVSPEGFVQDLLEMVVSGDFDVLLPFTHSTVLPVSYHKDMLSEHVRVPIAAYSVLRQAHDKLETVRLAQKLAVPTPVTFHPANREELFALEKHLPFPCLVKARQGCGVGTTIRFAKNLAELVDGYDKINNQSSVPPVNDYSLPIIQEYVPGQIHDAVFLYSRGECKAALTQERVITYPVQGGPGALNRTTDDPVLRNLGQSLLDALGWHGPAQVEFRLDPRDGQYKLLEINPKFWGTLPLAMVAGIDFAHMACQLAYRGDVASVFDYRGGVTYRWLFPSELNTLVQQPSRRRLRQFLNFRQPDTYYDWDARDPLPDLYRALSSIGKVLLARKKILPARQDLNALALQRPPAQQPAFGIALTDESSDNESVSGSRQA